MKPMFLAWGYGKNNNSPHIKVKIIGYIGYIGYNTTCGASNSHHDARKFCYSYCNFRYDARTEISDARSAQKGRFRCVIFCNKSGGKIWKYEKIFVPL